MTTGTQTSRPVGELKASTAPKNYTIISPVLANTEFSQLLTDGTKQLIIRTKGDGVLQIAWVATESGTNSLTIKKNAVYSKDGLNLVGRTIYMQVNTSLEIIQIEEWS